MSKKQLVELEKEEFETKMNISRKWFNWLLLITSLFIIISWITFGYTILNTQQTQRTNKILSISILLFSITSIGTLVCWKLILKEMEEHMLELEKQSEILKQKELEKAEEQARSEIESWNIMTLQNLKLKCKEEQIPFSSNMSKEELLKLIKQKESI